MAKSQKGKAGTEPLGRYRAKRDFARTPEPLRSEDSERGDLFVVHKHAASQLHYDLRLEMGGVLLSWAVPRGPSLDPKVKRMAVFVEDHPVSYTEFEGNIPKGQYGGGAMMIWDRGTWVPMGDPLVGLENGEIKFRLAGEKLKGGWTLVRLKPKPGEKADGWLLIKERDIFVQPAAEGDITEDAPDSVATGRSIEQIADAARPKTQRRRKKKVSAASIAGAKPGDMPDVPKPQLATLTATPPDGGDWLHEIKFDGYRTLCRLDSGNARMFTRNGYDWTDRYGPIAEELSALPCTQAIIDGELCVQDMTGATSFSALQEALADGATDRMVYLAFDILYLDGHDLTKAPLRERKAALSALLDWIVSGSSAVQYSEHTEGNGPAFFAQAEQLGLEGIISKKPDAAYGAGRTKSWLKTKCVSAGEFVIVGYTESEAAGGLASLLVAEPGDGGLVYVGKVGTGFSARDAARLRGRFSAIREDKPAVDIPDDGETKGALWVAPKLRAAVEYRKRTAAGNLRAASYKGLREGAAKSQQQAGPKRPARHVSDADLASVWITNPQRVMFGKGGPTKLDLALYYAQVGDWMLPELINRPVTLVRCPTGKVEDTFYQRHALEGMPAEVKSIGLREEGKRDRADYIYIDGAKGLLGLAQFGVIEFHPWGCRVDKQERPDRMIFDLDPDQALDWRAVVDAAFEVRDELERIGLAAFVRTTGGKGLHVVSPIERHSTWPAVKAFTLGFVTHLAKIAPARYTANPKTAARRGKIYLDYLRNTRSATAVGSYSLRARPGAPVATPLTWAELRDIEDPADFSYATVPARLAGLAGDPWDGIDGAAQRLTREMERKLGIHK